MKLTLYILSDFLHPCHKVIYCFRPTGTIQTKVCSWEKIRVSSSKISPNYPLIKLPVNCSSLFGIFSHLNIMLLNMRLSRNTFGKCFLQITVHGFSYLNMCHYNSLSYEASFTLKCAMAVKPSSLSLKKKSQGLVIIAFGHILISSYSKGYRQGLHCGAVACTVSQQKGPGFNSNSSWVSMYFLSLLGFSLPPSNSLKTFTLRKLATVNWL